MDVDNRGIGAWTPGHQESVKKMDDTVKSQLLLVGYPLTEINK